MSKVEVDLVIEKLRSDLFAARTDRRVAVDAARTLFRLFSEALEADKGHGNLPRHLYEAHFAISVQAKWVSDENPQPLEAAE